VQNITSGEEAISPINGLAEARSITDRFGEPLPCDPLLRHFECVDAGAGPRQTGAFDDRRVAI